MTVLLECARKLRERAKQPDDHTGNGGLTP
jgi:hypothetical protein